MFNTQGFSCADMAANMIKYIQIIHQHTNLIPATGIKEISVSNNGTLNKESAAHCHKSGASLAQFLSHRKFRTVRDNK